MWAAGQIRCASLYSVRYVYAYVSYTLTITEKCSYAVDAARAMVNGHLGDQSIVIALSLSGALMVLGLLWATRVFRKATA